MVEWKCWITKSGFQPQLCASLGKSQHFFGILPHLCGHLLSPGHHQLLPGLAPVSLHSPNMESTHRPPLSHSTQGFSWNKFLNANLGLFLCKWSTLLQFFLFKPFQWNQKQGTWSPTMRLAVFRGHFLSWIPSMNSPHRKDCSPLRHSKQATSRMRRLTESHDYVGSQRLFIHSEIFTEGQALC